MAEPALTRITNSTLVFNSELLPELVFSSSLHQGYLPLYLLFVLLSRRFHLKGLTGQTMGINTFSTV